jgi:hypothetical protein
LNRQNRVRLYFGLLFLLLDPSFFFFPNIWSSCVDSAYNCLAIKNGTKRIQHF